MTSTLRRAATIGLALAVLSVSAGLAPVSAVEEAPPDETTTTTEPPPPEGPPPTDPPPTLPVLPPPTDPPPPPPQEPPPQEPPPQEPPPEDPGAIEELPPEDVPVSDAEVPPAEVPPGAYAQDAQRVIERQLSVARVEARELESAYDTAKAELMLAQADLEQLEQSLGGLAAEDRAAIRLVEVSRRQFEARAADAVTRGDPLHILTAAVADDPNKIVAADVLLTAVLDADHAALSAYLAAKESVDIELVQTAERLVDARSRLEAAREQLFEARRANVVAQYDLAVLAAGSDIVIRGFVFPVGEPYSFGDSFGAPRMMGTEYEHAHQGTDILAPTGTPLFACERGLVARMGTDVLGGTKLWIKGESGTYYYYAHLSAFAEGIHDGQLVEPGEIVGYVGDTGNARGGPPHLHFQVHPGGGAAVNPYPLLKVVSDLEKQGKARAGSR
jgi:murein DD-endopeptidase MepM/ murein hydrolase activator NlpD